MLRAGMWWPFAKDPAYITGYYRTAYVFWKKWENIVREEMNRAAIEVENALLFNRQSYGKSPNAGSNSGPELLRFRWSWQPWFRL